MEDTYLKVSIGLLKRNKMEDKVQYWYEYRENKSHFTLVGRYNDDSSESKERVIGGKITDELEKRVLSLKKHKESRSGVSLETNIDKREIKHPKLKGFVEWRMNYPSIRVTRDANSGEYSLSLRGIRGNHPDIYQIGYMGTYYWEPSLLYQSSDADLILKISMEDWGEPFREMVVDLDLFHSKALFDKTGNLQKYSEESKILVGNNFYIHRASLNPTDDEIKKLKIASNDPMYSYVNSKLRALSIISDYFPRLDKNVLRLKRELNKMFEFVGPCEKLFASAFSGP